MKVLALAAVVIAGCATGTAMTSNPDPGFDHLERAIQKIDDGEKRCVDDITMRTSPEFAQMAGAPDASSDPRMRRQVDEDNRAIRTCQDHADRLREQMTSDERAAYQAREQEGRDRNSLMMILTASRPN